MPNLATARGLALGALIAFGSFGAGCSSGDTGLNGPAGSGGKGGAGAATSGASGAAGSNGADTGAGGTNAIGGASGTGGTAGTVAGSAGVAGSPDWCGNTGCVCSNGLDDDGDGLIDGFDPECTGPFDNDEGSFSTGIPGDNRDPKWQDCFFDGNSGAGDDRCRYSTDCLTGDLPQDDPDCAVSQACIDFCVIRTSNGCDCFGCCTVRTQDATEVSIQTGPDCALARISDLDACPRCTKSTLCNNDCGECELCPGKTAADLPDTCRGTPGDGGVPPGDGGVPPPDYTCDNGEPVCSADIPCVGENYCQLGCCVPVVR